MRVARYGIGRYLYLLWFEKKFVPTIVDDSDVRLKESSDGWVYHHMYTVVRTIEHMVIVLYEGFVLLRILLGHSADAYKCQ